MNANRFRGIVGVMALALGISSLSYAQSTAAPEPAQSRIAVDEKIEQKQSAEVETTKKGAGEGIKVHGHWIIDVKDSDGKVATHREFENSLVSAATGGGPAVLANLLLGSSVMGGWQINLQGAGPQLFITSPNLSSVCTPDTLNNVLCSANLTATFIQNGSQPIGFQLSGSIAGTNTQPLGGSISTVSTSAFPCASANPPTTVSPSACPASADFFGNFGLPFTSASTAVTVTAGQTVVATVQITFQ